MAINNQFSLTFVGHYDKKRLWLFNTNFPVRTFVRDSKFYWARTYWKACLVNAKRFRII